MTMTEERPAPSLRNLSAEAALLGSLIVNPDALDVVSEHIGPNDFSVGKNGAVYSAICMAAIEGKTGLAAIVEQLRKDNMLELVSEGYLHNLTKEACEADQLRQNVAFITDLSRKREKITAAQQIAWSVANGEDESLAFDRLLNVNSKQASATEGFVDLEHAMTSVLSGTYVKLEPTLLKRNDGEFLLYASKLNWIAAEPEALKSFTMLLACVQEMRDQGRPTVYVDFEDDELTVCDRLVRVMVGQGIEDVEEMARRWTLGPVRADGTRDREKALFHYIKADRSFDMKMRNWVLKQIQRGARLVVIDGCATAIALAGLNENDNGEVNKWISGVIYPLTNAGAGVAVIDHVTKTAAPGSNGRFARGASSKLAAVSGTMLHFAVKEPAGVYTEGQIELSVTKDRPGRVKVQKRSGKRIAGMLISKPVLTEREGVNLTIHSGEEISQIAQEKRFDLVAAEHVSRVLEIGPMSKSEVRRVLKERAEAKGNQGFRTETTVAAFKFLTDNGYVRVEKDSKTEMLTSLVPYKATYGEIHADDVEVSPF